jgi:hypothetical protein
MDAVTPSFSRNHSFTAAALGVALLSLSACSGKTSDGTNRSGGNGGSSGGQGGEESGGTSPGGSGVGGASQGGAAQGGASQGGTSQGGAGGALGRVPKNHRATAVACDHVRPTNDPGAPALDAGHTGYVTCYSHAECTDGENGRCVGNGHDGWHCTYDDCFADQDCPSGNIDSPGVCECEGGFRADNNVCLSGNCHVDSDCDPLEGFCSPSLGQCGNYAKFVGYYCHTPGDECLDDSDCGDGGYSAGYCAFMPTVGHWQCSTSQCVG